MLKITKAQKLRDAKAFFSAPRSKVECAMILGKYGSYVPRPYDTRDIEEYVVDLFLDEMVDHGLHFKR